MRQLKFRAWNKKDKYMACDISLPTFAAGVNETLLSWVANPDWELMQYTGLKDKNGVEIYEGDICRHQQLAGGLLEPKPVKNVQIVWTELHNGWICNDGIYRYSMQSSQLEVIGNIYANPELLTK